MNRILRWLIVAACGVSFVPGCAIFPNQPLPTGFLTPAPATSAAYHAPSSMCWFYAGAPWPASDSGTAWSAAVPNSPQAQAAPAARPVLPSVPVAYPAGSNASLGGPVPAAADGPIAPASGRQAAEPQLTGSAVPVTVARIDFEAPRAAGELLPPIAVAPGASTSANEKTVFPRAEPAPSRKSYVDPTAAPCFGHAADYGWISGQVEYSRIAKEWRLRYTSVDEMDQFGGRVILIENHQVSLLHDGQYVRVHGYVVNHDTSDGGPANYRIESFESVQDPNQIRNDE